MRLIDISGQRFGRLVVIVKDAAPKLWRCLCDCGNETLTTGGNLRNGSVRSCGCIAAEWSKFMGSNRDYIAKRAESVTVHGHKRRGKISPEYSTWLAMKRRCNDPQCKDYPNWGGRGIRVCKRWDESFENFLADMGPRPSPTHSIDRLKSERDYGPGNCRWATPQEQGGENKRTNIAVVVAGQRFETLSAACRHFGVGVTVASMRIRAGISPDAAVSTVGRLKPRRTRESYWPKHRR